MPKASDALMARGASETMGMGSASLTLKMRKAYTDFKSERESGGEETPAWRDWLNQQGYDLDKQELVLKRK